MQPNPGHAASFPGGVFTVSLDFELYWGVRDKHPLAAYQHRLKGARQAIPQMLRIFQDYGIHATWATVGFLFFPNVETLRRHLPEPLPNYTQAHLSPYPYIAQADALEPLYHFAPQIIAKVRATPGQEIGTHTFSHYYCLEAGQDRAAFYADLDAAVQSAAQNGITVRSLVFPRNQWNATYLDVLPALGIRCYRGNPSGWLYQATQEHARGTFRRALRLLDAYVNLSGHHVYPPPCGAKAPLNLPASRFLRPYVPHLAFAEKLKRRRILRAMTHAAQTGRIFHLWWHPHNFGTHTEKNLAFLRHIAEHYATLQRQFGMVSLNMGEIAEQCQQQTPP